MTKKFLFPLLIFSVLAFSACGRGNPETIDLPPQPDIEIDSSSQIELDSPSYNLDLNISDPDDTVTPGPSSGPSSNNQQSYSCPQTEWVNCMPGPGVGDRPYCQEDFLEWAKANCPGFQGAAL